LGSIAVLTGVKARKRKLRIRIRWRKVGGLKNLEGVDGEVFALAIGGILLYVGKVGENIEESIRRVMERKYEDPERIPRNVKVYVGKIVSRIRIDDEDLASLLVSILQPPWNLPEDGNYTGTVPVDVLNEGELPPGFKPHIRL